MMYRPWSDGEKAEYKVLRVQNVGLGVVYSLMGIPITDPEKRAKYLSEKLNLTGTDQDAVLTQAHSTRPVALKKLEEMFIANFF